MRERGSVTGRRPIVLEGDAVMGGEMPAMGASMLLAGAIGLVVLVLAIVE